MKRLGIMLAALMVNMAGVSGASATPFDLAQWATNKDGVFTDNILTPNVNFSSWSWALTFSGAGSHKAVLFVDPEIDQSGPGFWFNEYGDTGGSLAAGQSWEIDEPGWIFGDIVDNGAGSGNRVMAGNLDNTNAINLGAYPSGEDVSMALGWDFTLAAGDIATATFHLTSALPTSYIGYYLTQTDLDSGDKLYFYSTLEVRNGGTTPEPTSLALLALAVAGMAAVRRKA